MPGVITVLTGADATGIAPLPAGLPYPDREGLPFQPPSQTIFASDRVRHAGEIVAVVVAETAEQAQAAADAIRVDVVELPAVGPNPAPAGSGAPAIHLSHPGNVAYAGRFGDPPACRAAEANAAHMVEMTVDLPRIVPEPRQPRSALAVWDMQAKSFDVWVQNPAPAVASDLAGMFGLPAEQVRVHHADGSTASGAQEHASPEHAALLLAARITGRAVGWTGSGKAGNLAEGARLSGRLALAADGRFLSLAVKLDADLGAWAMCSGAHPYVHDPLQSLTGVYDIPAAAYEPTLRFTNAAPAGPCLETASPDIGLLLEHLVDAAARVTGIDRLALRRTNLVRRGAFPHVTALGILYDSGDYGRLLRSALSASDWRAFPRRQRSGHKLGLLRGIGLSLITQAADAGPMPDSGQATRPDAATFPSACHVVEVEIDPDTGTVRLVRHAAAYDVGTVIDADAVRCQMMAGMAQGLGLARGDAPLRAEDLPSFVLIDEACPTPRNPLGAKGIGNSGSTGALAAVVNAVADALALAGAAVPAIPFTPQAIFRALH